ncbi:MAG TPA: hypothetical protein VFK05_28895 [Polyangiaceae bacterium]|nr:hypothetical protein [Polyangiaceae bacterium]
MRPLAEVARAAFVALLGLALFASGCSSASAPDGCEPGTDADCLCPGGFHYGSWCGDDRHPVCDACPDGLKSARVAACEISECKTTQGDATGTWLLSSACPLAFEHGLYRCNTVSVVENLAVSGQFTLNEEGYATVSLLKAKAHLLSDQTIDCGQSCADITRLYVSIYGNTLSCPPGDDGIPCECERNATFLESTAMFLEGDKLSLRGPGITIQDFNYCVDGDTLTLSNSEMLLSFERAACSAGEKSCDGDTVTTCDGNKFTALTACASDEHCADGECLPACEPGASYCKASGVATCSADGVQRESDKTTECGADTHCREGDGCVPAEVDVFNSKTTDGRTGPAFGGNVIHMKRAATLLGFSQVVGLPEAGSVKFVVYQSKAAGGPFAQIWSKSGKAGPFDSGKLSTPADISLPLEADQYYAIGMQLPDTAEFYIAIGAAKEFASASFIDAALVRGTGVTSFSPDASSTLEDPFYQGLTLAPESQ